MAGQYKCGTLRYHRAMLVLHHAWRSSASRRVRLCLEEKGLAYESHPVDLAKMEHHTPEYLRLNPNGVIPALVHDGRALHESGTICEYIDEAFDGPPLRPDDAFGRATMRNWIRHADERIGNLIIFNWVHNLAKTASQWSDAELAERLKKIPSKERQAGRDGGPHGKRAALECLARGRALLDRRHRAGALRQAHRRRNRARRGDRRPPSARRRVVENHPGPAGLRAGQDWDVR
jgi:hypothetical protein